MRGRDGSRMTTDHSVIRKWIEDHGGVPAAVKPRYVALQEAGVIRVFFPGRESGEDLEPVSWEKFFEKFDQANLVFLFNEDDSEESGHFFKFMSLDGE